ncbi:DUF6959 family protein [Sorangium sp. So ce1078]|uniref:DUF6959 family protein n=1 Tax=Sorangium sp. So ce1078 TaxID=3133329 RepID=UPI003F62D22B
MKRIEIDVVTDTTNTAVVRMPGRRFPGIVMQGDSLNYLRVLAVDLKRRLAGLEDEDLADTMDELETLLQGYARAYEASLEREGIELPYPKPET